MIITILNSGVIIRFQVSDPSANSGREELAMVGRFYLRSAKNPKSYTQFLSSSSQNIARF